MFPLVWRNEQKDQLYRETEEMGAVTDKEIIQRKFFYEESESKLAKNLWIRIFVYGHRFICITVNI